MNGINPHEYVGTRRDIWWNELENEKPILLEFIDYFKGKSYRKGRGYYVIHYAIARADYPSLGIISGDKLIVYIALKSYINALTKIPVEMKVPCTKEQAQGKNLLMKFQKCSKEHIKIISQEPREPTPEQLIEAKQNYDMIDSEKENVGKDGTKE